jgi:hypothetical protein
MENENKFLNKFKTSEINKLDVVMRDELKYTDIEREALLHALLDIAESFEKVYSTIIPQINLLKNKQDIREGMWELREEFRHIQYHINDAKLTEL